MMHKAQYTSFFRKVYCLKFNIQTGNIRVKTYWDNDCYDPVEKKNQANYEEKSSHMGESRALSQRWHFPEMS